MKRSKKRKRHSKFYIQFAVMILFIFLFSFLPATGVFAANGSWTIRENDSSMLGDEGMDSSETDAEPDSIIKHYYNIFYYIGEEIRKLFTWSDNLNRMSIDGLILGSMNGTGAAIAQFDLNDGNGYGVVGATFYVALRRLALSLTFVLTCWIVASQGLNNGAKARATLKEQFQSIVFMLLLLYIMPQFVQFFLIIRDNIMQLLSGYAGVSGILMEYRDMYRNNPGLINGFLYCAAMFANIFFLGSYVTVAMTETILFGLFPVFAILSIRQKKMFENWMTVFFSNLAIPMIDYALLLLPAKMTELGVAFGGMVTLINLFIIWSIIPARNAILKTFGNVTGVTLGGGMGALGMLGMMAAKMALSKGSGDSHSSGGNRDTGELKGNADMAERMSEELGHNQAIAAKDMADIDSLMSDADIGHSTTTMTELQSGGDEFTESTDEMASLGTEGTAEDMDVGTVSGAFEGDNISMESGAMALSEGEEAIDLQMPEGIEGQEVSSVSGIGDIVDTEVSGQGMFDDPNYSVIESGFMQTENHNLENMELTRERIADLEKELPELREKGQSLQNMDTAAREFLKENDGLTERNNTEIGKLQATNTKLAGRTDTDAQVQIAQNNAKIQSLRAENQKYEQARRTVQNNDRVVKGADGKETTFLNNQIEEHNAAYHRKASQLESAKMAYGKQQMLEKDMANARKASGGSGEVFESSAQFKAAINAHNKQAKYANYKNFESNPGFSFMSAEMKADYYRHRAARTAGKKVGATIGGIAGGVAGATIAGFGGANAMIAGGVGGTMVGKTAGGAIGGVAKGGLHSTVHSKDDLGSHRTILEKSAEPTHIPEKATDNAATKTPKNSRKGRQRFSDTSNSGLANEFSDMQQRAERQMQIDNARSDIEIVKGKNRFEIK